LSTVKIFISSNNLPHVLHGVDNIAGAGFSLGADHGRALGERRRASPRLRAPHTNGP